MSNKALIIDDEADIRELVAMSLDRIGFDTHTAANLEEARHLLDTYDFDVCLTDMRLPDGNGVEFVTYIQSIKPQMPVAVITAHGNVDTAVVAMKNGAFDFVSKPIDLTQLRQLVLQAVATGKLQNNPALTVNSNVANENNNVSRTSDVESVTVDEQLDLTDKVPDGELDTKNSLETLSGRTIVPQLPSLEVGGESLIGQSDPMRELRKMIAKVARTNAPVWITGESGTGKELIARLIHRNSSRAEKPFIAVNCGAIPSELMESEMFGHRKGSFTGAHADHDGLFKRAEGGTLFLDEVAELPLSMQVKLLRVIQERSVRRVGDSDEMPVDVRILSASHKDLNAEVNLGNFRHDLYYRLNVICVKSPSLRDRPTDIVLIARHVLNTIQEKDPLENFVTLSSEAEDALTNYYFPGNVRELENILERAIALADASSIKVDDLNLVQPHQYTSSISHNAQSQPNAETIEEPMDEVNRIEQVLYQTRWNRKAAAEILGLSYRQLRYRLQQYGIDEKRTGT
ncbi:MAG: sigma-54-dependent transcriptional regulator [Granulosicoccus sp.]